MDFAPLVALASLVISIINVLKYLRAKDWNGALTQISAWVAGIVAIVLVANTDWADGIDVGGVPLGMLNGASLALLGLTVASTGSVIVELKKAVDQSDSAMKPDLF